MCQVAVRPDDDRRLCRAAPGELFDAGRATQGRDGSGRIVSRHPNHGTHLGERSRRFVGDDLQCVGRARERSRLDLDQTRSCLDGDS